MKYLKNYESMFSIPKDNYYTMLINHLDVWKDYPKRELICSLKPRFGGEYRIIPFDGSKWVIVPKHDIQDTLYFTINGKKYDNIDYLNVILKDAPENSDEF